MDRSDRKEAVREYKLTYRPMGVFQIRNKVHGLVFVDSSVDLPGKFNRHRFQLNAGVHPAKRLQSDWTDLGGDAFEFEVLEHYEPLENSAVKPEADLDVLENLWLEKLGPYGEKGYNERKLTRGERLQMIAASRKA